MNKVLIISDSHGLTKELFHLKERFPTLDIIHCGDSELPMDHPALENIHVVRGNCDFDPKMPYTKMLNIHETNFLVTHGHLHYVGRDLTPLSYLASENNANIVCYGHTHRARADQIGDQIFINPGSIHSPRDRKEKAYALLEFKDSTNVHVNFYTLDGKIIRELSFTSRINKK